jgi:uncharacterized OB-fold protein
MTPFPTPVRRTEDSAEFFDMAAQGKLMLRRCLACGAYRAPQDAVCPACHHSAWEPVAADGAATLVTWTVVHRSPVPGLDGPYVAAMVESREGPWILVRLLDSDGSDLHVGTELELVTAVSGDDGEWVVAARRPRGEAL